MTVEIGIRARRREVVQLRVSTGRGKGVNAATAFARRCRVSIGYRLCPTRKTLLPPVAGLCLRCYAG